MSASETNTLHVYPVDDLIEHNVETADADCTCGPALELCSGGWIIHHHSLDGREHGEGGSP